MKKIVALLILTGSVLTGLAQDPYFTQYNNSRLTVNPAFAGSDSAFIVAANFRLQWPKTNSPYRTMSFSADKYIHALRGGIGINYLYDYEANGLYTSSRIDFNYAPHFELLHHTLVIQPGIQFSYLQNTIDFSKLTFGNMIDDRRGFVYNTSEAPVVPRKNALDLSAGLLIYNKHFWGGIAVNHLTQPDMGVIANAPLPIKITVHGGANLRFSKDPAAKFILSPTLLYMRQQDFEMWLPGVTAKYRFISLGISYRNEDAFITTLAFQNKYLRVGYSYDYTISKLGNEITGGSHEIGFSWFIYFKKHRGIQTLRLI